MQPQITILVHIIFNGKGVLTVVVDKSTVMFP